MNTSIIGANGVMNRLAEDGVLVDWFRKPHKRFGTTYRLINVIARHAGATIILSRGDVNLLGEAYAFGVVWSFFLKSLGVLVLRYKRHDQEYKMPLNFQFGQSKFRSALPLPPSSSFWWPSPICSPSRSRPSTASVSRSCCS